MDELHTFVSNKKVVWLWTAVDEQGREWMDFELDSREAATGLRLWVRTADDYSSVKPQLYKT